ncbi:SUF system NifU family Fe-S cluster assembly protein [Marinobacterium sp. D7]|uniref:Fe-S cluster assembly sulfur transfer protein SufU n=1 Tax=Marinobacterium ramblicola TaxID=2849041 RepID=UPI001C2D11B4|nr:SUF system NifU family Fe-S cluster assembly protein [Marinobacterium ramblicola]MBV1789832.1 SUF system NifU family Fe-S cluster assembly protein [Marinobacterium ramblicola]
MDDELRELYQQVIIDHGRHPRNFRRIEGDCRCRQGYNPLCGDQLELCLQRDAQGQITDVAFQGQGCAISMASASMLSEVVKGKTPAEAERMFDAFHRLLTGEEGAEQGAELESLGKLRVLAGVREFPSRIKCATLAWHALMAALEPGNDEPVTTE